MLFTKTPCFREETRFAKGPVECQTRKMLLMSERKKRVCVCKSVRLHGKHTEALGQAMVLCFQEQEATRASCFHESCSQV